MSKPFLLNLLFTSLGIIILFAVFYQNHFLSITRTDYVAANYFSYFTILSNILVACVLIVHTFNILPQHFMPSLRGAATLYILITFIVFITIMGANNNELLSWVNIVVHFLSPLVMLVNVWLFRLVPLEFKNTLPWIALLFIYFLYTLIRGAITGWYPYNFVNPMIVGYSGIVLYVVGIAVTVLGLDLLLLKLFNNS